MMKDLQAEKCDLTFVTFLVIEKTVPANAVIGHAVDHGNFYNRIIVRLPPMMAEKVVAGGNVKMTDFHQRNVNQ
jgi:hypothetical protein